MAGIDHVETTKRYRNRGNQKDEIVLTDAIDGIDTNNILEVTIARGKGAILDTRGHIIVAPDEIKRI